MVKKRKMATFALLLSIILCLKGTIAHPGKGCLIKRVQMFLMMMF